MTELLEVMTQALPVAAGARRAAGDHARTARPAARSACDPAGPLVAEVVKTTTDPYVGRISLVRVFSGTLRPDTTVHVSGHFSASRHDRGHEDHDVDERVGALSSPLGKTQRPVAAGDRRRHLRGRQADPRRDRRHAVRQGRPAADGAVGDARPAAAGRGRGQVQGRRGQARRRASAGSSPRTRRCGWSTTRRPTSSCCGAWARRTSTSLLDRLQEPLRRRGRLGAAAGAAARDVRRPGHGPRAATSSSPAATASTPSATSRSSRCRPAPGFEFVDKVVGGAVPRQFIPSVEKGVRTQMERGVAAGYPVVDIRVTLVDGKAHSVDSSDMAFQTAGALALKEAAKGDAGSTCSSRSTRCTVLVSDEYVGAVMSDLSTRRGRVPGTEPVGSGRTLVRAEVPAGRDHPLRRSTCARSRTAPARSPGPTCGTSRCRPSSRRSSRRRTPTTMRRRPRGASVL